MYEKTLNVLSTVAQQYIPQLYSIFHQRIDIPNTPNSPFFDLPASILRRAPRVLAIDERKRGIYL